MDSPDWKCPILMITLSLSLASITRCGTEKEISKQTDIRSRFPKPKDVREPLDYMHQLLDYGMPWDDRCRRYAVLLSLSARLGSPSASTTSEIATLDKSSLDEVYEQIEANMMSSFFMYAIDMYRITYLSPVFIDLVECLRRIGTQVAQGYTKNEELIITEDLYKQVLGLPHTIIDINNLDMTRYPPAFRANLGNLFREYFDIDSIIDTSVTPARPNVRWRADDNDEATNKQRESRTERHLRYRERNLQRERERSRLNQQRMRVLQPELSRARNRVYQQQRRDRLKQLEKLHKNLDKEHQVQQSPAHIEQTEHVYPPVRFYEAEYPGDVIPVHRPFSSNKRQRGRLEQGQKLQEQRLRQLEQLPYEMLIQPSPAVIDSMNPIEQSDMPEMRHGWHPGWMDLASQMTTLNTIPVPAAGLTGLDAPMNAREERERLRQHRRRLRTLDKKSYLEQSHKAQHDRLQYQQQYLQLMLEEREHRKQQYEHRSQPQQQRQRSDQQSTDSQPLSDMISQMIRSPAPERINMYAPTEHTTVTSVDPMTSPPPEGLAPYRHSRGRSLKGEGIVDPAHADHSIESYNKTFGTNSTRNEQGNLRISKAREDQEAYEYPLNSVSQLDETDAVLQSILNQSQNEEAADSLDTSNEPRREAVKKDIRLITKK